MTEPFPGQEALPHMPDPVAPEPPEPLWIEARIEIEMTVKVDVAGLVFYQRQQDKHYVTDAGPLNYDDITEDYLTEHGYGPDERGSVFVHNNVMDTIDVSAWHGAASKDSKTRLIEEVPFGDLTEIKFKWDERLQEELDGRLPELKADPRTTTWAERQT